MEKGVVYCATGKKYIKEAIKSAKSLEEHNSEINKAIFAGKKVEADVFDQKRVIKNPSYSSTDKIEAMRRSPYEKTIFLDTDTIILDDIGSIFQLLDRVDIAASRSTATTNDKIEEIPCSFPELNTGVVAFNNVREEFFQKWRQNYRGVESKTDLDQPSFRKTLFESGLAFSILPPEFNYRFVYPGACGRKIRVLHGRTSYMKIPYMPVDTLERVESKLNQTENSMRSHYVKYGRINVENWQPSLIEQFFRGVHRYGFLNTLKRAYEKYIRKKNYL